MFKGVGVALVTPFINNQVNFEKLDELIQMQLDSNIDALIILGTTAESSTLSDDEKKQIIDFSITKVNKKVPVIVGTGSPDTRKTIELSNYATNKGADGLLIVTPYYNKPNQRGLIAHYSEIASKVNNKIILYNVPSRTNVNLTSDTVIYLSKIDNIVGIKEASGDLFQIKQIIKNTADDFYVYSGNDDQTLDILKLGGVGVISVCANIIPRKLKKIVHEYLDGNLEKSKSEFEKYRTLMQLLFIETNPSPIKEALNYLGHNVGSPRLPLVELSDKNKEVLRKCLINLTMEGALWTFLSQE